MNEISHPLKQQFILLIENDILLIWDKPKDLWSRFDRPSESLRVQIYSLIKQLEKFGYVKKFYDQAGNQYYSETDKLTDFRVNHCTDKATKILTEKLRLLDQEKIEKDFEIQITRELSKQLPEVNFCLKNYIIDNSQEIIKLDKKTKVISKILQNIESYIF